MMAAMWFLLLTAGSLLLLLRPWWSRRLRQRMERRHANVRVYEARLRELEADAAAGVLAPEALDEARQELGQRLLEETQSLKPGATRASSRLPMVVMAVFLPLFGLGAYALQGSWRTQAQIARAAADPQYAQAQVIEKMMAELRARVAAEPEDAEAWSLLGRSYLATERHADAAAAYARANALLGHRDPDLLVAEGEALGLSQQRDLLGRPAELFQQALVLAPAHPRALWYAGLAAAQAGDSASAVAHWQALLATELPANVAQSVRTAIAELESGAVPDQQDAGVQLRLRIELEPKLADRLRPGDVLFIVARAAEGPTAPLAVRRLQAAALPVEVVLDDRHSMVPGLALSGFPRWTVSARISRSGRAEPQSGDLQGRVTVPRSAAAAATLRINEVLP